MAASGGADAPPPPVGYDGGGAVVGAGGLIRSMCKNRSAVTERRHEGEFRAMRLIRPRRLGRAHQSHCPKSSAIGADMSMIDELLSSIFCRTYLDPLRREVGHHLVRQFQERFLRKPARRGGLVVVELHELHDVAPLINASFD